MGLGGVEGSTGASHFFFSSLAYKAEAMRRRLDFADCVMGAALMALMVVS